MLFADDATVWFNGENISDVINAYNTDFDTIFNWTTSNRLLLNCSKRFGISFACEGGQPDLPELRMNNSIMSYESPGKCFRCLH